MKSFNHSIKKLIFSFITISLFLIIYLPDINAQYQGIDEAIAKYRKGTLTIKAKRGDRVTVEQLRHEFWFGCAIANNLAGGSMPENNIPLRGHNLFWGIPQFVQPWVKDLNDDELRQTLQNRAETVTRRYKGRF